ncbi:hypothetical protein Maqu_4094 (plasmid) [Marinobacter nauticus VT8]|uniref:Uncharacterized protein n=2 Tax=Marinobacter nauticus TaxID=2743 RepID=A1U8P5_MARN8|nr:hypothetical protein Maqu_4094 [Marinobacter nauticus VT8]
MDMGMRSKSKAWVNEFLFIRGMISGPDGSPLYLYHVTDEEFAYLPTLLRQTLPDIESPVHSVYWSAAFCLFVAEKYRREYDGTNLGWSWEGFEKPLSIKLPSLRHSEIVRKGLEFWRRPIRLRTNGHDYLGSLFDEGGLPWRLIQSDTHGFGRAVRGTISNYYRVQQLGGDIASTVSNYAQYFPQTFRTHEKYLLIASIVEWLMGIAEAHPIASIEDPADYLDEHAPDWRKLSPLPVSEGNARNLINEWLKDAGKSRSEKKRIEADEKNFSCDHWLKGTYENWALETEVFLPSELSISLEGAPIQSTRVEVAFYEGDELLRRSGIVHGKVNDDRSQITLKINNRVIRVGRVNPELPLTVQLLSNGQRIDAFYFEGSEVDFASLPLIFIEDGGQLKLASTASTTLAASYALVRVPPALSSEDLSKSELLGSDQLGAEWIRVSEDITFVGADSRVVVRFDPNAVITKPTLAGTVSLYDTLPNLVYRGWPNLRATGNEDNQDISLFANGKSLEFDYQKNEVGSFSLSAVAKGGETVLRRKIGVIPKDLRVISVPASTHSSAKIILRSVRKLAVHILDDSIRAETQLIDDGCEITLEPIVRGKVPQKVNVALSDGLHPGEPVILRLPYPRTGAQLYDDVGTEVKGGLISLDQLIGMSMTLTPKPDTREQFFVSLELVCPQLPNFRRHYPFTVNAQAQRISLYAFEEDIQQMLGTTSNQDAFVRISVETDRILKQLNIVRYDARLEGPLPAGRLEVVTDTPCDSASSVRVSGMRLDDPRAIPVEVPERVSQGVGMGVFEIPPKMMKNGPWLLFPPAESSLKFRPTVWVTEDSANTSESHVNTLHSAAKAFHPVHNPNAFDQVIWAMARDFSHSGWDYLRALKEQYSTLPLSAFESWKALANNTSAIAAAVFRLEFDPAFCRRLSNELAVIWETVNVQTWIDVRAGQSNFLVDQGIPEELAEKLVEDRISSVATAIPCFMHLSNYLREPKHVNLEQVPYVFAKICFEDLRRNHADDQRWPEWFKVELTNWIHQQSFPAEITTLPDVGFSRAVAYLPVFMAAVTAGKTNFSDLTESLPELKFAVRVLSDFDRDAWYEPTYSLVLSNLLLETEE